MSAIILISSIFNLCNAQNSVIMNIADIALSCQEQIKIRDRFKVMNYLKSKTNTEFTDAKDYLEEMENRWIISRKQAIENIQVLNSKIHRRLKRSFLKIECPTTTANILKSLAGQHDTGNDWVEKSASPNKKFNVINEENEAKILHSMKEFIDKIPYIRDELKRENFNQYEESVEKMLLFLHNTLVPLPNGVSVFDSEFRIPPSPLADEDCIDFIRTRFFELRESLKREIIRRRQ